tara:strand:- start:831 stop:1667 length:837 start_codon:yes stop_codon:yes gene_type:complete
MVEGKWITIGDEESLRDLKYDITDNSIIQYPSFSKFNIFNYSSPGITLYKDQEIYMSFKNLINSHYNLTVYDKELKQIYDFNCPISLLFSTKEENKLYLKPDQFYYIFLRSNITENYINNSLVKFYKERKNKIKLSYNYYPKIYIDEEDINKLLISRSQKIIQEMKEKNYQLKRILHAEEYYSFPNTDYAYKNRFVCDKGDKIILICTNKRKNVQLNNHLIEINSQIQSLNWFPEGNDFFSHIILDNSESDNDFYIYERLYGVNKKSKILPFMVLIFD